MRSHQFILRQLAEQGLDPSKAYVSVGGKLVLKNSLVTEATVEAGEQLMASVYVTPVAHVETVIEASVEEAPAVVSDEVPVLPLGLEPAVENPHIGSTLDSLLEETGDKEDVEAMIEEKIAAIDAAVEEESPAAPAKKAKAAKTKK